MDISVVVIIITILIGCIGVIAFLMLNKKKQSGDTITLIGQMGAGKTALFYRLISGRFPETLPSMAPNEAELPDTVAIPNASGKGYRLYDIPGHGSFSTLLIDAIPRSRVLVYVLDSTSASSLSAVASDVYSILTNASIVSAQIPLVVCGNKIDVTQFTIPQGTLVKKIEDEIEIIRKAHAHAKTLESLGSDGTPETIPLTEAFRFETQTRLPIAWAMASVKEEKLSELYTALSTAIQ